MVKYDNKIRITQQIIILKDETHLTVSTDVGIAQARKHEKT